MKIIIDNAIPYIKGVLEPFFEVVYKVGRDINSSDVADCSAMMIRTRTKCDNLLLENSRIKFIGTATIGHDHIDLNYCNNRGIKVATAAGCNALAVVQYLLKAIEESKKHFNKEFKNIAIIGVGNVGGALNNELIKRGYNVMLNDPPRSAKEPDFKNVEIEKLLNWCDVVTFHVPLNNESMNLASDAFFRNLGAGKLLINTSRGEVIDEKALVNAIDNGGLLSPIIDVWCNEPNISKELLNRTFISTPHIAGYSEQGKANGASMIIQAIAKEFSIKELINWYPTDVERNIYSKINPSHYDIIKDSTTLRENISDFELLRNNYNYRKEF